MEPKQANLPYVLASICSPAASQQDKLTQAELHTAVTRLLAVRELVCLHMCTECFFEDIWQNSCWSFDSFLTLKGSNSMA